MEDNSKIYGRNDFVIEFAGLEPETKPVSESKIKFKRLVIQCPINNSASIFCGGEEPKVELVNGSSHDFFGGYLHKVFVTGEPGDFVHGFYEY
jgi:hypothetical protein